MTVPLETTLLEQVFKYSQDKTIDTSQNGNDIMQGIDKRHQGLAGRFTYGWKYRYFFDFNFGYNGSENFAPGHQYGFFPSLFCSMEYCRRTYHQKTFEMDEYVQTPLFIWQSRQ